MSKQKKKTAGKADPTPTPTPAAPTRILRQQACFNCGDLGHISKDCGAPKRPTTATSTSTGAGSNSTTTTNNNSNNSNSKDKKNSSSSSTPPPPLAPEAWRPISKRAVRANGGVVTARGPREVAGGVMVKEWQRLPKQLLQEYIQREKRPRAIFPRVKSDDSELYRCRVILPDSKGKIEKDINLCPIQSYSTQQEAEEYASLLALYYVSPSLPLERKFPEPYASVWLSLQKGGGEAQVKSSSKYVSESEKREVEEERRMKSNERERRMEEKEKEYAQVFMSDENRKFVEQIIRTLTQTSGANGKKSSSSSSSEGGEGEEEGEGEGEGGQGDTSTTSSAEAAAAVDPKLISDLTTKLTKLGFHTSDITPAISHLSSSSSSSLTLDSLIDYLCLHLPESDLPPSFDPRGKQLEVISAGHTSIIPSGISFFLGIGRMGIPLEVVEHKCRQVKKEKGKGGEGGGGGEKEVEEILLRLYREMYAEFCPSPSSTTSSSTTTTSFDPSTTTASIIADEITALSSIFDSDFRLISPHHYTIHLQIPSSSSSSSSKSKAHRYSKAKLEVLIPENSFYPYELPCLVVRGCDDLSAEQRLHIIVNIAEYVKKEGLILEGEIENGEGVGFIYQLIDYLKNELERLVSEKELKLPKIWREKTKGLLSDIQKQQLIQTQQHRDKQQHEQVNGSSSGSGSSSSSGDGEKENGKDNKREYRARPLKNDPHLNSELYSLWQQTQSTSTYQSILRKRLDLPVYQHRSHIISTIASSSVTIISGATGSGKSTQCPQFILDGMVEEKHGSMCNILVTQPRRVAAVGVAERVAAERGEKCGQMIGYRIRNESKISKQTRLTYVTTGMLLRQLQSSPRLEGISHIVIDEAHERSTDIDFLLIILKPLLSLRSDLKLILMSATADFKLFSSFFSNFSPPTITVPGRTFPVHVDYLEEIMYSTGYIADRRYRKNLKQDEMKKEMNELKKWNRGGGEEKYDEKWLENVVCMNEERIQYDLIEQLIFHILEHGAYGSGGILIFLPGLSEISRLCSQLQSTLESSTTTYQPHHFWILPLHGQLSTTNQNVSSNPLLLL